MNLYYLIVNNELVATQEIIDTISNNFSKKRGLCKLECYNSIEKYNDCTFDEILVLVAPANWDSYIICSVYLDILKQTEMRLIESDVSITDMIALMVKCTDPDPLKRETLEILKEHVFKLKMNYNDRV